MDKIPLLSKEMMIEQRINIEKSPENVTEDDVKEFLAYKIEYILTRGELNDDQEKNYYKRT